MTLSLSVFASPPRIAITYHVPSVFFFHSGASTRRSSFLRNVLFRARRILSSTSPPTFQTRTSRPLRPFLNLRSSPLPRPFWSIPTTHAFLVHDAMRFSSVRGPCFPYLPELTVIVDILPDCMMTFIEATAHTAVFNTFHSTFFLVFSMDWLASSTYAPEPFSVLVIIRLTGLLFLFLNLFAGPLTDNRRHCFALP